VWPFGDTNAAADKYALSRRYLIFLIGANDLKIEAAKRSITLDGFAMVDPDEGNVR
jgi:hypothetical protein